MKLYIPLIDSTKMLPDSKDLFEDLMARGLMDDIANTPPYEAKEQCFDNDGKPVTTAIWTSNSRNHRICYTIPKLFEKKLRFRNLWE